MSRTFAVTAALFANLFAAGVPAVHAIAHELAEDHHPAQGSASAGEVERGHDEVHPASLHDEQVLAKRHSVGLPFHAPAAAETAVPFAAPATIQHHPALRLASRAPPSPDLPRGPPPS